MKTASVFFRPFFSFLKIKKISFGYWFRAPVRHVLARQLYFTGLESLLLVVLIGVALGAIVVAQLHYNVGQSGAGTLRLLAPLLLNELAPLLTALILIARSSSAMASELAAMRVNHEINMLMRFGISPAHYLVLPRVLGMVAASGLLATYLALSALLTAALMMFGGSALSELGFLADALPLASIASGGFKVLMFGAVIAGLACRTGFQAGQDLTEIPRAASRAVVRSLLAVFILDALWGWL